jgi:hypothetical protein
VKTRYLYDEKRHLVCEPYSIYGLHKMALELGIKRCWFHGGRHPHYDLPKKFSAAKHPRCERVSSREILRVIKIGIYNL